MDYKRINLDGVEYWLVPVARPDSATPIGECVLSTRGLNALKVGGIVYLEQVLEKTEADLLRLPNFGRKNLNALREVVTERWPHLRIGQFKKKEE